MNGNPSALPLYDRHGNPKKNKNARRKARPGWRPAQAAYGIGYAVDPKKPQNNPKRVAGRYEDRRPETIPSPNNAATPHHSPEGERADSTR
jgi:hypothetical protein